MSSTICSQVLDVTEETFPEDLLLRLARPFKDHHGTHLLGYKFLFLDPGEEDTPYKSGFLTYEQESYFQSNRLVALFENKRLQIFSWGSSWEALLLEQLEHLEPFPRLEASFTPSFDKESFLEGCYRVKDLILDGLVYQMNLSHEIKFFGDADPLALYEALMPVAKAPFSAYICHKGSYYISLSPERLLSGKGGLLETKPIKGTIPRGPKDVDQLIHSEKERAELLMITDLMRNDLYSISERGSIHVEELLQPIFFPNLVHLQSVLTGELKAHIAPIDALKAISPGGSITGCPKLSAIQYIQEIEKRERHIFTGSIGYIDPKGDFDFNIAIRTLVRDRGRWTLQVGAGIVFDSDPEKEFLETLCKAKPFFDVML